jgi:hypothetical protein
MGRLGYVSTLIGDFIAFAREHKAWWIVPLLVVLGLVALLIASGQAAGPFLYTLF